MHDIDLIPPEYRLKRELLDAARTYGLIAVVLVAVGLAATGLLAVLNGSLTDRIQALQGEQAITDQQRVQLESLRETRDRNNQQLELLTQLRSGTSAREIFIALDQALQGDDIWFRKWTFKRAMEALDEAQITLQQQAQDDAFLIVIPVGQTDKEYWEIRTHMTVDGEARDHAALSDFVARLYARPAIEGVKILQTSRQVSTAGPYVKFQLAIVVGPGRTEPRKVY